MSWSPTAEGSSNLLILLFIDKEIKEKSPPEKGLYKQLWLFIHSRWSRLSSEKKENQQEVKVEQKFKRGWKEFATLRNLMVESTWLCFSKRTELMQMSQDQQYK